MGLVFDFAERFVLWPLNAVVGSLPTILYHLLRLGMPPNAPQHAMVATCAVTHIRVGYPAADDVVPRISPFTGAIAIVRGLDSPHARVHVLPLSENWEHITYPTSDFFLSCSSAKKLYRLILSSG